MTQAAAKYQGIPNGSNQSAFWKPAFKNGAR
jgi:hypothetical protein